MGLLVLRQVDHFEKRASRRVFDEDGISMKDWKCTAHRRMRVASRDIRDSQRDRQSRFPVSQSEKRGSGSYFDTRVLVRQ